MNKRSIESRTAEVILERPRQLDVPWGVVDVPSPTLATLIMVSEQIADMPEFDADGGKVNASLRQARHYRDISKILAILMLGAKKCKEKPSILHRIFYRKKKPLEALAERITLEMSPSQINSALAELLSDLQLGDFFSITTFLTGINLTRRTKVDAQTQSGQQ